MPRPRLVVDYVERVLVACMNIIYSASRENRDVWSANGTFGTYYTMIRTSGLGLVGDARNVSIHSESVEVFIRPLSCLDLLLFVLFRVELRT